MTNPHKVGKMTFEQKRCSLNISESSFSEMLSLLLVCRKRTVDSTTLKEGGERHGSGMWSDSACVTSTLLCTATFTIGVTRGDNSPLQWSSPPQVTLLPHPHQCKPLSGTAHHSTARFSIINTRVMGAAQRKYCSPELSGRTRERAAGLVSLPEMHRCSSVCGLECALFVFPNIEDL